MSSASTPQDTVERALSCGTPGFELIVVAEERSSVNLRWAANSLTTNGIARTRSLKVIAISRRADGSSGVGTVTRSALRADQIPDIVAEAEAGAAQAPPAEDATELVPEHGSVPGSVWQAAPAYTDVDVLRPFAAQLGDTLTAAKLAGRALYGFAEHQLTSTFLATSTGLRLRHDQPTGRLQLNAKSPDLSRTAWSGVSTPDFTGVDVAALDQSLAQRLAWQERQLDLPAGRYETLLSPAAVADLMINLYWVNGARAAQEGRTAFHRPGGGVRIGDRLAAQPIDLFSDPARPGLECIPFVVAPASAADSSVFDNGLPIGPTSWISAGELSALRSSRHSADGAALPVTPAADNLVLTGPADSARPSLADMIARTDRALLVTCLWYIRKVDLRTLLLTGLTRDGVYLIEQGEVVGAVNNFRFNESPVSLLDRLLEVGETETRTLPREWSEDFTRCAMPPVRAEAFNLSSVSQAL